MYLRYGQIEISSRINYCSGRGVKGSVRSFTSNRSRRGRGGLGRGRMVGLPTRSLVVFTKNVERKGGLGIKSGRIEDEPVIHRRR